MRVSSFAPPPHCKDWSGEIITPVAGFRQSATRMANLYGFIHSWQDGITVPELPDIVVYLEALEPRILHQRLERVRVAGPFLLRTATPPLDSVEGKCVVELRRIGKRIAIGLEDDLWLV